MDDAGLAGRGTGAIVGPETEGRGRYITEGEGGRGVYHEGCKHGKGEKKSI